MSATARAVWISATLFVTAALARRPGEPLRPGYNMFSKQQDVQLGQANAKRVLEQYQVVKNQFLQDYVGRVGNRLAEGTEAKQSGFHFNFTVLNVGEINAFALPGGPMFIYTGLLKACDNEAQLAGVVGHEMSQAYIGEFAHHGVFSNNGAGEQRRQLNEICFGRFMSAVPEDDVGLGANSVILKFSRDAESEADALGSHLMAEAGYSPIEMAHFFEKLSSAPHPPQFLSDHPNPGNREKAIQAELQTLPQRSYTWQTGDFSRMKSELARLPSPPQAPATPQ